MAITLAELREKRIDPATRTPAEQASLRQELVAEKASPAAQEQNSVREGIRARNAAPTVVDPKAARVPTASEALAPGLNRGVTDTTAARTVANQRARVVSGQTGANIERIQAEQAATKRQTAIREATGEQPRPLRATVNQPILDPRSDAPRPPAGPVEGAVAKATPRAADDVANKAKQVFEEATTAVKDATKNPQGRLNKLADAIKGAAGKAVTTAKTIGGKTAPSKAVSQEAQDLSTKMKNNAKRVVKLGLGVELANAMDDFGVRWAQVGFDQAADEVADSAIQGMSDMMTRVMQNENLNERDALGIAAQGSREFGNAMVDMVKGMGVTFGADVPQKLIDISADFADMIGVPFTELRFKRGTGFNYEKYVKPEDFRGFEGRTFRPGVDAQPFELGDSGAATEGLRSGENTIQPNSPNFIGPADPGELPGRPGERFNPVGAQPSGREITQDPFLQPGAGEGQLDIRGLRGGTGSIDATNATGGPRGFAQRVEESRRAGAFEPVSQERRDEASRDLDRVRKGTAAFRDLAATRLGVPVQYLDAVRSGGMTPREANLAQAKQNATGNAGGMTPAEAQTFQIQAQQASQSMREFATKMDDRTAERFRSTGNEVADTFPNMSPEQKADVASQFQFFAPNWLPEGTDPTQLSSANLQRVKGQFILATALAQQGEGWLRALQPWKSDITASTLFSKGEDILLSMTKQGKWFDIGDDNLLFRGRDSSGEPVTLTIETEKLPGIAQQVINQARSRMNIQRQGLPR